MKLIRDPERPILIPRRMVNEWLPTLKGAELKIILVLESKLEEGKYEKVPFGMELLKDWTGLSQPSISKSIKSLIEKGFLTKQKEGKIGKERVIYKLKIWEL